ncbi:NUDIX domain-containing protein [Methylomonas sp. AM2-LC]|uniref:NUDIX hydrolase n=1 Tax=Methylomonas sp. AM2-LC TaxID=3153301 RepID=UPI0032633614
MHNEYLVVVDLNDQVIGLRPRHEIHTLGLLHRAVHILVFNQQGHLFLQKRSMLKDLNKGLWDSSAAGHVDNNESYDASAQRELYEELGIKAALKPLFKLEASVDLGMEFIQVYQCQHNGPFNLAADEIDEGTWLPLTEINNRVMADDTTLTLTFKIIWKTYQPYLLAAN